MYKQKLIWYFDQLKCICLWKPGHDERSDIKSKPDIKIGIYKRNNKPKITTK